MPLKKNKGTKQEMITGELKNKVDKIWEVFWTGGITNPLEVIEQFTYLLFIRQLDDVETTKEHEAGFLVEAQTYLREHEEKLFFDAELNRHFHREMFTGFDMDRTMLRIGAMNMLLHGVDNPVIEYRDSLSEQNTDSEKYTLVLANPPFKGSLDYEGVSADLLKVSSFSTVSCKNISDRGIAMKK